MLQKRSEPLSIGLYAVRLQPGNPSFEAQGSEFAWAAMCWKYHNRDRAPA